MGKTNYVAEPGRHDIIITRTFDAPRDLVFRAYTDPDLVAQWWGTDSLTTHIDKLDVKPGGLWRFVQKGQDGEEYAFKGVYHDITPSERVIQTFEWEGMPGHVSLETLILEEEDGKTKMTSTAVYQTIEDRDGMFASGMQEGATESLDSLERLLQKVAASQ